MTLKYITYLVLGSIFCFLLSSSCSDDNTTTTIITEDYKDAQIYSFTIKGEYNKNQDSVSMRQDSIRFLQINRTKFAIDQVGGVIYNPDSMPYGTQLRKLLVTATFNPIYGAGNVTVTTPDSINGYIWNKTDSIDFSKAPVRFAVNPYTGGDNAKTYRIEMRIHQVDPDTLIWTQQPSYTQALGNSKTLLIGNEFYTYTVVNNSVRLYVANKENLNWQTSPVSGLPSNTKIENFFVNNSIFYVTDLNGISYTSVDGRTWNQLSNGKSVVSILGVLPGSDLSQNDLLITYSDGGNTYLGKTKDMATIEEIDFTIPNDFPVQGNSSYSNFSSNSRNRMLVLTGGIDKSGEEISNTWIIRNVTGGIEASPFIQNTFFRGAGISTFLYDDALYTLSDNQFYTSVSWGQRWVVASTKQMLDSNIGRRSGQTVIIDDLNYIWIFGGVSESGEYYNDVWRGRLNRLNL